MAITTTQAVAPYDQRYYDSVLIDSAIPQLVYEVPGQKKSLPKKMGKVVNFREFEILDAATTALTEGQTPAPSPYSVREVTATVSQYGFVNGITDMVDATKPDPHMTEIVKLQGQQAGNTKDQIIRDTIMTALTADYGATAAGTITDGGTGVVPVDATILDKCHRVMRNANAPYFTELITGGSKISSVPVGPCYLLICHPSVGYTIRDLTGFHPTEEYSSQGPVMAGEFGKYRNFRCLETTNAYVDSTEYHTGIFAPNAFGVVALNGMDLQSYHQGFGSGEDILEQRAKQGWKAAWVAVILNNAFMMSISTTIES